jgi:hypothetical protein
VTAGRVRRLATGAVIVLTWCAVLAVGAGPPASAAARPVGDCTATSGATVLVDFSHWGGPLLRACGSTPTTGYRLLNQGGWRTSGTEHDGPGFICRIGYAGFRHGTQYPTPATQACVNTPSATAYWAYWQAGPGQRTWSYSQSGAIGYHPPSGSISLWTFGGTNIAGTAGSAMPAISPAQVRLLMKDTTASARAGSPSVVNAPPTSARPPAGQGSSEPALITLAIVAALALATAAAARRRRERVPR